MKFDLSFTTVPFTAFCDWYQFTQLRTPTHQLNNEGVCIGGRWNARGSRWGWAPGRWR